MRSMGHTYDTLTAEWCRNNHTNNINASCHAHLTAMPGARESESIEKKSQHSVKEESKKNAAVWSRLIGRGARPKMTSPTIGARDRDLCTHPGRPEPDSTYAPAFETDSPQALPWAPQ